MIHNFKEIDKLLNEIKTQAQRDAYKNVSQNTITILEDSHEYYFVHEVDPHKKAWTPLAQSTIDRKGHNRILYETGTLMDSLSEKTEYSIRTEQARSGAIQIEFGTRVPYAHYHQYDSGIPVRQHVGMGSGVADIIASKAMDQIMENIK